MADFPRPENPPYGLGITSLVLGSVGLMLFFLPILGAPLSVLGLVFGLVGVLVAVARGPSSLRWSVLGIVLCSLSAVINLAIAHAPGDYVRRRGTNPMWRLPPDQSYVPPPAPANFPGRSREPLRSAP